MTPLASWALVVLVFVIIGLTAYVLTHLPEREPRLDPFDREQMDRLRDRESNRRYRARAHARQMDRLRAREVDDSNRSMPL